MQVDPYTECNSLDVLDRTQVKSPPPHQQLVVNICHNGFLFNRDWLTPSLFLHSLQFSIHPYFPSLSLPLL